MWRCCLPCVGCFCVFVCLVLDCVRSYAVDIWYDGIVYARVQKAPVICWSLDFEAVKNLDFLLLTCTELSSSVCN